MNQILHNGTSINKYYENGANILLNRSTETQYFYVREVEVFAIKRVD